MDAIPLEAELLVDLTPPIRVAILPRSSRFPLVIPTGAYPDFLLRAVSDVHVCGSSQREPHADHQGHKTPQEIRGSAVEGSAVRPADLSNPSSEAARNKASTCRLLTFPVEQV
jgi:hypothetical protein